jgi:hypothetical protein
MPSEIAEPINVDITLLVIDQTMGRVLCREVAAVVSDLDSPSTLTSTARTLSNATEPELILFSMAAFRAW